LGTTPNVVLIVASFAVRFCQIWLEICPAYFCLALEVKRRAILPKALMMVHVLEIVVDVQLRGVDHD